MRPSVWKHGCMMSMSGRSRSARNEVSSCAPHAVTPALHFTLGKFRAETPQDFGVERIVEIEDVTRS